MNAAVFVPLDPSVLVTTTSTVPAVLAGVNAVIVVLLTTATFDAAVPPIETVAPGWNPWPVIVIEVPPTVGPEEGETELTAGAAAPPHGSTVPTGDHPLDQRHHCESVPNT